MAAAAENDNPTWTEFAGFRMVVQFEGVGGGSSAVYLADVRLGDDTRPDPQEIPAGTLDGLVTVGAQHTVYMPAVFVPSE